MSYTTQQITLQTFIENGLIPKGSVSFAQSIATSRHVSAKQAVHIDRLIQETLDRANGVSSKPKAPVKSADFSDTKLFQVFDNARSHLKYPKITLQTNGGLPVRLTVSAKYPDTVWLNVGSYGSGTYGCIVRGTGYIKFHSSYGGSDANRADLTDLMSRFCHDPEQVSHDYGKLTHNCCYCLKGLTTPESLAVGYGPECAKHYGLAWGKKVTRIKPIISELVEEINSFEDRMRDEYFRENYSDNYV